jgi:RES domain-containing protein
MRYTGLLYRALNPVYAKNPPSGTGARRHGGRFNPKGMPALYTSQSVMTAIREANQIGTLQPTTLVAYEADVAPIFDATDAAALEAEAMTTAELAADDWRLAMLRDGQSATQRFAARLKAAGYAGIQVRSYTKGSGPTDLNLILWVWSAELPTRLLLVDDEGRLA